MWLIFAIGSAVFAGITSILAKCGIRHTDSTVATALRTVVVLLFSWILAVLQGTVSQVQSVDGRTWLFLILSGLATGASWLCYFRALQIGDVNKVVVIDKSSTVLSILLAFIFLQEGVSFSKLLCVIAIGLGTLFMISKKAAATQSGKSYLIYALFSAIFASLTSILGKIGIENVDSNLGTAIRTCVVLVMSWIMVFVTKKGQDVVKVQKNELLFIVLSGFATGGSWLCYYKALQQGPASVVVPIDKLSILVTIIFSLFVFHEKLNRRGFIGLLLILAGTIALACM